MMKPYTISEANIVFSADIRSSSILVSRDTESYSDLFAYLQHGHEALEQKLKMLKELKRPLTRKEAEELRLILNTLISVQGVIGSQEYLQNGENSSQ